MRVVFADTVYWIALINPRDRLYSRVLDMPARLGDHRLVTSEMIFVEVLNSFAGDDPRYRSEAAALAEKIVHDSNVNLVPRTAWLFRQALALYQRRPDKEWSLTDCISFSLMSQRGLTESLTADIHFRQAGFKALLLEQPGD